MDADPSQVSIFIQFGSIEDSNVVIHHFCSFSLSNFFMIIATVVKVPAMGDSISEGVIEEFVKRKFSFFIQTCMI